MKLSINLCQQQQKGLQYRWQLNKKLLHCKKGKISIDLENFRIITYPKQLTMRDSFGTKLFVIELTDDRSWNSQCTCFSIWANLSSKRFSFSRKHSWPFYKFLNLSWIFQWLCWRLFMNDIIALASACLFLRSCSTIILRYEGSLPMLHWSNAKSLKSNLLTGLWSITSSWPILSKWHWFDFTHSPTPYLTLPRTHGI